MNSRNKLAEMPIRPLLYTMAFPLMLSLLVQSLYNIVDSIFVARLSETALTAASLVYSIQFLMIAVGVGTAVGLNALLSKKIGEHKPEEACRAATTGLFLMILTSLIFSMIGIFCPIRLPLKWLLIQNFRNSVNNIFPSILYIAGESFCKLMLSDCYRRLEILYYLCCL